MKKYMRVCVLTLALLALMALPAFAGYSDVLDKATNAVVTIDSVNTDKLSTVQYTEAQDDGLYLLLVLDGYNTLVPTEDNILYVEQAQADGTTVTFTNDGKGVYPSSAKKSTVCLAGPGLASPIKLANLKVNGVTVSGKVKSYNPGNATTVQLMKSGVEQVKTTIVAASGSGQLEQSFSIDSVNPDTYDLVVTKAGHLTYTITGVVVGDGGLDLTGNANAAIKLITLLCGDVTGDHRINNLDYAAVMDPDNFNKLTSVAGVNKDADLDGNGSVNNMDYAIIMDPKHFNKIDYSTSYSNE